MENKFSVDEKKNKKALILFKKEKSKKIISQENRNNSKENLATKITNNTTNNTYINSNSKTKTKSNEPSTGIRIIKISKNKNEVKKNNYLIKKEKNVCNKLNIRKKLEHNSSYNNKKPKKINTENNIINNNSNNKIIKKEKYKNNYTCNNNEPSSYIKLKIKEKSKENKSNISNYDKRRNYNVPKLRIKKTNENETRKEEDTTYNEDIRKNEKEKNVQKLLENISYIKNFQKMIEKEMQTKENKDYENKRKFIEDNGYDLLSDEENKEENDNDEEIKSNKEEEKNEEIKENNNNHINNNITNAVSNNSITNNNSSNINNNYNFISNNNVNMNLSGSSDKNMNNNETENNKKKEKRKSNVDTLEYCNRINNYINIHELKKDYYNLNININDSLGDSFRKSFSNSAKKEIKPKKEKKLNMNDNNSSDSESKFNYDTKENKRSETEIKKYMEKKKKELKLEEEKKKKKTQEKKLNRYLILNKLNEDIMSNMNKNMSKIKNDEEKKDFNDKIPNEYFVGKNIKRKNSNISHTTESSQSTVLDQNNYYLDLIMSKNILSNNIINNNFINYNNKEINNEINSENNQIITTKDKDIQNTNEINTNNSNNKLSQEIIKNNNINKKDIYSELQLKCKETLDKANVFFSETNMKALIQQYKENNFEEEKNNTSEINNNDDNNNDNNNDNNIIINSDKKDDKKDDIIINSENNVNDINNDEKKEIENIIEINKKEDEVIDININDSENNKVEEEQIIIKEETKEIGETKEIEENNEKEVENKKEEIIPTKKTYEFSQLVLENYYKIFISLEDYLNSLTKKNALNDIITYGESRFSYKIGFENLVILIKSFPFNLLRMIYQRQYYKDVLRQFFIPYIRRAFNNINLYAFYLFKFSEINKAIEQIYRIIFLKRLNFYAQVKEIIKKEFNEKINGFIIKINIFFKKFFLKQLIQDFKSNNIDELSDKKNNTYFYESFSEKSSLTAYPNTEGSARLHKVYELLEMQRKPKNEEENNLLELGDNNSLRSIKSVEEKKGKNLLDKMKEEENLNLNNNIHLEDLKNNLNNEINNTNNNNNDSSHKGCIKKIEIINNFKINKNNNESNNENNINNNTNIILETSEKKSRNNNTNENKEKNNEIINNIDLDINNTNTNLSKSNNLTTNTNDIMIKISEDLNSPNPNINNISLGLPEKDKSELSDNNRYPKSNTISERNEIKNEINLNDNNNDTNNILKKIPENIIQNISDDLCQNILNELIVTEIKDKKKLFPKRKKEFNSSLNNSSGSLLMSQNSLSIGSHSPGRNYPQKKNLATQNNNNDSYQGVNSSQTESMLNNSIFMRTVDEIKKEKNLNFYNDKISKKFLEKIEKNLDKNYEKIIDNLKNPFEIDEAKMINGLMLRDKSLSISSKIRFKNEKILKKNNYIDKKIISDFEIINKEIRDKNNITKGSKENIIYDNYLNQCIYDTINELIEKERKYGIIGAPLFWSIRTKEIDYKYKSKDSFSKNIFINKIMSQMNQILNSKMGLIAENYEYLDMEQLNSDRDKKFMESITQDLKENELYYQIFETQETYVKLSLSRIILDQLLNEIVEILEHVQYSRKEPDKYQSKSIYACEDIPRLSFQPQTLENNYTGENEGDESINQ